MVGEVEEKKQIPLFVDLKRSRLCRGATGEGYGQWSQNSLH